MYQPNTYKLAKFFQHSTVFETALFSFHLLKVNEFKVGFQKQKTKVITYFKYKTFDNNKFRSHVLKHNFDKDDFVSYKDPLFNLFNKHVTLKKKSVCANEAHFMTKTYKNNL